MKDLDYVRLNELKSFFNMTNGDSDRILRQIEIDVNFLMTQRFMDYSLLMAIKKVANPEEDKKLKQSMDFDD